MFEYLRYALSLGAAYLLVNFLLSTWRHRQQARKWGCKPAPKMRNRIIGGLDHIMTLNKADKELCIPKVFMDCYEEVGCATWRQDIIDSTSIFTVDPKNIQAILATKFNDFELGDLRRKNFSPLLGVGIFTADGKTWEHSRLMLRPQFSRDQVADLQLEERHVQDLFRCIRIESSGWTTEIDLGPLFFRLTLDSATEFLFGESVHSQLSAFSDGYSLTGSRTYNSKDLANSFDRGTSALGIRSRVGTCFWMFTPRTFKSDCAEVHRFADYCVNKVLTKRASGPKPTENGRYIFLEALAEVTQDPVELRSQLLNILLAGRDTTAGLLGWTFWSLIQNPEIYEKLRAAVLNSFGPYDESAQTISHGGLKACSYLQYVLSESLRLYPSVPLNARSAVRDTCLPRGGGPDGMSPVYVKKGAEVSFFVYVMHRRKDIWGPDADFFKPERWVNRKHSWDYLPFNGGPRICLGQQFALTEAGYVLARIVQRFDKLERRDFDNRELHSYGLTTSPKQVVLKLHEAGKGA